MKMIYFLPAAMFGVGLAAPSFAQDTVSAETKMKTTVEKDDAGNYTKKQARTTKTIDESGTTSKTETKVKVESDADGDAERTITTETSTDPKGLMNKSKTMTTDSVKYEDGKVEKKYKKTVDGKTVEETTQESEE